MVLVAGLLAAADDVEGLATLADHSAAHAERRGEIERALRERAIAEGIRAAAKLLRSRASAEKTDQIRVCDLCLSRLAED